MSCGGGGLNIARVSSSITADHCWSSSVIKWQPSIPMYTESFLVSASLCLHYTGTFSSALQYDDLLPSLEAAGQIIYGRSDPAVWIVYHLAQHGGWQWCSVLVSLRSLLPNMRCWAVRTMTWFSHMQLRLLASDQIFIHMYVFYYEQMQYVQILEVGHI